MDKTVNMGYIAFISLIAALGGLLFGYDTAVISGTISMVTGQFALNSVQSGWYVDCALVVSTYHVVYISAGKHWIALMLKN